MVSTGKTNVLFLVLGFHLCLNLAQGRNFYNVGVKYGVTMNVYSGRDNPSWVIDDKDPMYSQISWAVNSNPPTDLDDDHLGYCGFTVQATNALGQTAYKTVGRHTSRTIESMLLRSCPSSLQLSSGLMNHVTSGIMGQIRVTKPQVAKISVTHNNEEDNFTIKIRQTIGGRKKRQAAMCATRFAPENWNYAPVQRSNNCYNYATNIQTNTFAQPGRASGRRYTRTTAANVYAATLRDGLTPLSRPDAGNQCLVALVIWPGEDYHFLRLDNDGSWSQKSGRTRARNVDDSGRRIFDPRTADRGPYVVFAGFLGVGPSANVR
ncbi:uncharacterized protein LOC128218718 [Mya arenaria]|uniref:uncharacterized protein LOC128218718 n=1 Tax=Mya arenaria TaxID=6604 RepID=UPI0022E610E9|nr:uncharacterized protein LOC128218718 [Mya arenaria]